MKLNPRSRLKTLVVIGTALVGMTSFAAVYAGPAMADPTETYIAVGSDTTENVIDQFAIDQAGNELGSYDAVNPVTQTIGEVITPAPAGNGGNVVNPNSTAGNCSFTRPDGSGQGKAALIAALGGAADGLASSPGVGCVDIARSSSAPTVNTGGSLVYIPFAEDAVTGATGAAGTTKITTADSFTLTDLKTLYASCANVTEGGVTYNPNTASGSQVQIDLYVPQPGSGTLSFWATTLGFSSTTLPACVHQTILAGANSGSLVEENDGTAVTSDPNGYMPFSIAQWVSQRNHPSIDRRHSATEHNIGGVTPCVNPNGNCSAAGETLNPAFPITREVYNIVTACRVDASAPNPGHGASSPCTVDPGLQSLLVGPNSALCQDSITIKQYGFAVLNPPATGADACGADGSNLRSNPPPV